MDPMPINTTSNTTNNKPYVKAAYSQSSKEAMRNPWFLAILGIVAVFVIVNIIFIVFAIATDPGLVSEDYYQQGQDYEKNIISRRTARENLQWETKTEIPSKIYLNKPDMYRFSMVDSRGIPIKDADVRFVLYRPSDVSADFVKQVEQIAPGLYQTELSFSLPGVWDIKLKVLSEEDNYNETYRITVLTP